MKQKTELSELQIASKLKAGKDFVVTGDKQRRKVLVGARFAGVNITTRADGEVFHVIFLP